MAIDLTKIEKKPSSLFYPCPVTLVTCLDLKDRPNIITLAWIGVVCSDPPIISLGIRLGRYSNKMIEEHKEFVINIPTKNLLRKSDLAGMISGRDYDKFKKTGLTPEPASRVKAPLIKQCPLNLECVLKQKISLGSHDLFLGEVVAIHIDKKILDAEGNIDFKKADPILYSEGEYWSIGKEIGKYGFSKK